MCNLFSYRYFIFSPSIETHTQPRIVYYAHHRLFLLVTYSFIPVFSVFDDVPSPELMRHELPYPGDTWQGSRVEVNPPNRPHA